MLLALLFIASIFAATPDQLLTAGKQALRENDPDKAVDLFEQLVKANPNSSEAHLFLGRAYGRQARQASMFRAPGLASKARTEFETAVKLDPNSIRARSTLADYYVMAPGIMGGSYEKALEQAQEIKKRDALTGHFEYAEIYNAQKKPDQARAEMIAAVREQPNSAKAHFLYGLAMIILQKNYKDAEPELETALKLDPDYMEAYFRIGQLSVFLSGKYERGEEALKKYLAYTPKEDEPPLYRAHYWLGQIYEKQGRKADAKQSYATSLKLNPAQTDVTEALKRVS
ncbi:MAG TPA: tetratricopeptide repeat protein [Thermoanaerobaculia bacterium]|jgi:tetratricopeptide (TPR) repeat protein